MTQAPPGRTRRFAALGLAVTFVLGATLSGVLIYRTSHLTDQPLSLTNSGGYVASDQEAARVKAVAEQFALRVDSLSSKDVAGYVKSVGELLTTKCKTDFDKAAPGISSSVGKTPFTTKGYLRSSGIVTLDRDSASVMVVHDALKSATTGQGIATPFRWTVSLRKVGGTWQVDGFVDPDHASFCGGLS